MNLPQSQPNDHLNSIILSSTKISDEILHDFSRSELDSHVNMVVLGKDSFPFESVQDQTCDVIPFDPSLGTSQKIPIIDGALTYDCPFRHETFVLVFHNTLHIPHLDHSLIPPFILREAGLVVNEKAKIHTDNPQ